MAVLIAFCLNKTRLGLAIRACGENPKAAEALSYSVWKIRYGAVAFGGMMAGFSGAYASAVYTPLWADGMIAGRGWIAVALVVFGTWKTSRIFLGAYLFGMVTLGGISGAIFGFCLALPILDSDALCDYDWSPCNYLSRYEPPAPARTLFSG